MIKPVVFFGSEDFSALSLQALIDTNYIIEAVVTKPDSRRGRGRQLSSPLVKQIAESNDIAVIQPTSKQDLREMLQQFSSKDYVGVLVSYGLIIPQDVIDLFNPGIINVHPSLLPKYRGPAPIESAIVNGDQETGVTLMQLSKRMDAGPIYAFSPLELTGQETQSELYSTLGQLGAQMLAAALPGILSGSIDMKTQDESQATYTELLTKQMGILDPAVLTAREAERRIRGYLRYPKTKLIIGEHTVQPVRAHVSVGGDSSELSVNFKDNTRLVIDELVAPSGKLMSGESFIRGYGQN